MDAMREYARGWNEAPGTQPAVFFPALADFDRRLNDLAQAAPGQEPARTVELFNPILADYLSARQFRLRARAGGFSLADHPGLSHTELCLVHLAQGEAEILFPHQVWQSERAMRVLIHRAGAGLEVIEALIRHNPALSGSFLIEIGDGGQLPSLSFSASHPRACPIPDPEFWESYGHLRLREEVTAHWVPWEERERRIFWRGVTTGARRFPPPLPGLPDDLRWLPRLDLCMAARRSRHREMLDVALSGIVQITELHLIARIEEAGLLAPPVPHREFMKYRGRLVIDGNANAWADTLGALLMGNCMFLVASEQGYRQWYYDAMRPWEHYVPVASDLSDLDERIEWFLGHEGEARAIAAHGKALADRLTFGVVYPELVGTVARWVPQAAFREAKPV